MQGPVGLENWLFLLGLGLRLHNFFTFEADQSTGRPTGRYFDGLPLGLFVLAGLL